MFLQISNISQWWTFDLLFFNVPLAEEIRHMLAFTNTGKQYIYTRMSQGFELSPNVFNQMLKADFEDLSLHSLILQYKDDWLIFL